MMINASDQSKTKTEFWYEMFNSKEWLKPIKKNLAMFLPKEDDGKANYPIAIIGEDKLGKYAYTLTFHNLSAASEYSFMDKTIKGFMPLEKAAQLFPQFFPIKGQAQ